MQATRDSGREILPGYNADEPGGCYTIEALAGLLGTAEPAPNRSRNTAPTVRATVQAGDSCAVATIWDDCPAAEAPLEAFRAGDGMHNAAKDLSFLAGRRGYSADEIEAGLLEQLAGSEIHASRPERVQELLGGEMRSLAEAGERAARVAPNLGAVADFSAAEGGQPPEEGPVPLDARERMLDSIIYIEERDEYFDRYRRKRMTKRELNCRYNRVGPPSSNTASAAAVFDAEPAEDDPEGAGRRMTAARLTYRPGQPLRVVNEDGEREINIYTPSKVTPVPATDEDIEPWLAVVRHVFAEHTGHFCDYFGCVLQNPGRKINHTPLVKSIQGTGKSTIIKPLQQALGEHNCVTIGPQQISSSFNSWYESKQLVVVEEMQMDDQKSQMNTLKSYLVNNPSTIMINKKGVPEYPMPNIAVFVFFSNLERPVHLEDSDRRFFIVDSKAGPLPPALAQAVNDFLDAGGAAKVAGWLLARDVSGFDAFGPAPMTDDKAQMIKAGRSGLQEWVDDCIADQVAPFDTDIICLQDVCARVPRHIAGFAGLRPDRLLSLLKRHQPLALGDRLRLGWAMDSTGSDRARLYAIRRQGTYAWTLEHQGLDAIKELFRDHYRRAGQAQLAADVRRDFPAALR